MINGSYLWICVADSAYLWISVVDDGKNRVEVDKRNSRRDPLSSCVQPPGGDHQSNSKYSHLGEGCHY